MMKLWRRWRRMHDCFHHDRTTGESWIEGQLIDCGRRKMFWCRECDRAWFP